MFSGSMVAIVTPTRPAGDPDWPARSIDAGLQPLHQELFVEANPIPVKWDLANDLLLRALRAAGVAFEDQVA
jgi:hypothetical protein